MTGRARAPLAALGAMCLLAVALSSCASTLGYAALVNGTAISQASVNQQLADISANKQYVQLIDQPGGTGPVAGATAGTYNKAFVAQLLDQQVRYEIIRQKLAAAHALPSPAKVASAKSEVTQAFPSGVFAAFPARYQNLLAGQQANADAFVTVVSGNVPPDVLNQFYQSHLADYATEACVRHILIADKDASGQLDYAASLVDAQKVKAMLDAGADFTAMAKQYSQDNQGTNGGSAAVGGNLQGSASDGCLTSSDLQQLITEFAQAVTSLPVNQVSLPVKTQFGYHLIEVTKRVTEPLDATVTTDIQRRLAGQALTKLVSTAKVKVNPEFGTFNGKSDANGQIPGVTPPAVPNLTSTAASATAGSSSSSSAGTAGAGSGSTSGG
jgi:parvulin-like peptidyl-prolyl isomerase